MKRSVDGIAKTQSTLTLASLGNSEKGIWSSSAEELLWVYTSNNSEPRSKIAAFDMDGTLITTKSGKVFPVDTNDWKLLYDVIPIKIKEYYNNNFKIVIFSNQKGLQFGKVDKVGFKHKIERVVAKIGVPMQVFLSIGDGEYRKPSIGMWRALKERQLNIDIDMKESFYVGDAAGRHKTKNRVRKDHSFADRFFAHNIGLEFFTPEQFFLRQKVEEPWGPPSFDPAEIFKPDRIHLEPDAKIPSDKQEIIVMCGSPGSGKSTFAKKLANNYEYEVVNRDTLGTWQKCAAATEKYLKDGKSVIVDNTNPDIESRKRYIDLAKKLNVKCRCFQMNCTLDHARHNVRFRSLTEKRPIEVNTMVLRMFEKKFTPPKCDEGFDACIKVNPIPEFESDDHKTLYMQYLID